MIASTLLALALTAADPNMPKHFDTYGMEATRAMIGACTSNASVGGFEPKSIEGFCACHVFWIEDTFTRDELSKIVESEQLTKKVFDAGVKACAGIGYKLEPKAAPKSEPPWVKEPPRNL